MKKAIAAGIIMLSFVALIAGNSTPVSALTVDEIQTQIQGIFSRLSALQPAASGSVGVSATSNMQPMRPRVCDTLSRSLSMGARGDDVASLQEFLSSEGYFSANATGYFGLITANALARRQASQGVSAVGVAGPMTRAKILARCGVANFVPPPNCKTWNDGCNICSRQYPGGPVACTLRACLTEPSNIWAGRGYCTAYFDDGTTTNRPPTVSSFSGPTSLAVNVSGTWTIQASDPENGSLSYSITWGDESGIFPPYANIAARENFVQTTTFTHAYAASGTYTVTIVVRDSAGKEARASGTVRVEGQLYCTMQYEPVCGQPPEPACRYSVPACMMPSPGPQTYGNMCVLQQAGATYLYSGECRTY